MQSLKFRAFHSEIERRHQGIACDIEYLSIGAHYVVEMGGIEPPSLCGAEHHTVQQLRRAPEGPEGQAAVPVGGSGA